MHASRIIADPHSCAPAGPAIFQLLNTLPNLELLETPWSPAPGGSTGWRLMGEAGPQLRWGFTEDEEFDAAAMLQRAGVLSSAARACRDCWVWWAPEVETHWSVMLRLAA